MKGGRSTSALAWDEELASPAEILDARAPLSPDERKAIHDLVHWFTRRYPTYAERDAYIRRKWQEAQRLRQAGVR